MARTKRPAKPSDKLSKRRRQDSDGETSSEEYEPTQGNRSGAKKPSKRTHEEVVADDRKAWLEGFKLKRGKNERQVNERDLGEDLGVTEIRQEGLEQWFEPVPGYNLKSIKEFYKTMKVEKEGDEPVKIKAKVAGKLIQVTPDHIAEQLKYTRPDPKTINYPGEEQLTDQLIKNFLYEKPNEKLHPINPGRFLDDIRILNKAIHANLYPKGKDTKPSRKSLELMASFVDQDTTADWAHFILRQMVDYLNTAAGDIRMWFPCLITKLCHSQGVKGPGYSKMEPLEGGVIDSTTLERSKAQTKNKNVEVPKANPSSAPDVSASTVPPPPSEPKLPVPPPEGSEATKGCKQCSEQLATVLKKLDKIEKENKLARHNREWQNKVLEGLSGQRYDVPPELLVEDSDDKKEDEDVPDVGCGD
ncbi:hypothetical protein Vadar_023512 [Vaccinium darrowii]|uniref:Uncharacterized protein n=1 Tax=Vaccinium darrowii TaxID=229202 RepID=A0ACB7ZDD1_9ERIC|nr:hypothetical protein Vadar_023512 [Vaccinium darrowii]